MAESALSLPIILASAPCFGSFVGLAADRLPGRRSVLGGRSCCDSCKRILRWPDLIPIASWLALQGRCRHCGAAIGCTPLLAELAALVIAVWAWFILPMPQLIAGLVLGWSLLLLALIDLRHMLLPDRITLPLLALGLAVTALIEPARLPAHVIGAAAAYLGLALVARLYAQLRGRAGLGGGDGKLLAALGAWLGWEALPSVLLIAGIAGLLFAAAAGRLAPSDRIAFGPALGLAGWIVWLHGPLTVG